MPHRARRAHGLRSDGRRRSSVLAVLVAGALLLDGCALWKLRRDIDRLNAMGLIGGRVMPAGEVDGPVIVALAAKEGGEAYEPDTEPAAFYGPPAMVAVAAGEWVGPLDVRFGAGDVRLPFAVSVPEPAVPGRAVLPGMHLGDVVRMDDPRFSKANGKLDLWQPVQFLYDVGAGIYFLDEATSVYAFNESHTGILASTAVARTVNTLLAGVVGRAASVVP